MMVYYSLQHRIENISTKQTINFSTERKDELYLTFTIQLTHIKEKYYQKYYKLQDLAAQVGGIVGL